MAVLHLVELFEHLKYLKPSVIECPSDLYCVVPVLRVIGRLLFRLRDVAFCPFLTSFVQSQLIVFDSDDRLDCNIRVHGPVQ